MTVQAELVMVGTELLLGEIEDTNATFMSQELALCGINLYHKSTVGDNWLRLVGVLSQALVRADVVITSGGIGPTMDDITREAVAAVVNLPLVEDEQAMLEIREFFAKRHLNMVASNQKQALLPKGANLIPNRWGTAPGFICEYQGKTVISLPGVPTELRGMFSETVVPYLTRRQTDGVLVSRVLNFVGIGESALEEALSDLMQAQTNPTIAPYAALGAVRLRITAKAQSMALAQELIAPVEQRIRDVAGKWLYAVDDLSLEQVVGEKLCEQQATIATAESCTGGLIAHRLTNVPGSSAYLLHGYVTYANAAKVKDLGVELEILERYGAVSEETALAMARGARSRAKSTWGLAVTGIAGPGGGSVEKPVGLVHMALACEGYTIAEVHYFRGAREGIKYRASQAALDLLRRHL